MKNHRIFLRTEPDGECLLWQGAKKPSGYGNVTIRGKTVMAHRLAWIVSFGPIPEGMSVLHRCDRPSCINPHHLFLGTQKDNCEDMASKERSYKTKLTAEKVKEIRARRMNGDTLIALGKEFGVSFSAIHCICIGKTWKHV